MPTQSDLFSDIRIFPVNNGTSNLKANGKVVIAGTVEVSFMIMNGKNGMFVSLPSQKVESKDGSGKTNYYPYVKIIDPDTKTKLDEFCLAAYNNRDSSPSVPIANKAKAETKKMPF